ncbi:MAG: DUF370 domain-containing protein [Firmicutes bacterium]|nr:DUF370 domain-containing protein [Bacillota bacterium]
MFIHLGGDTLVNANSIIAIINIENKVNSNINKEFFKTAQEEGFIRKINNEENYNSMIITDRLVYLSPISSVTLKKRASFLDTL